MDAVRTKSSAKMASDDVTTVLRVAREELSVAEWPEIRQRGQSRISTHLAQLKVAGLVEDRRSGKSILYRLHPPRAADAKAFEQLLSVLRNAAS